MKNSCANCIVHLHCKIRLLTFISISNDLNKSVLTAYDTYLTECPVFCQSMTSEKGDSYESVVNDVCKLFDLDPKVLRNDNKQRIGWNL